MWTQNKLFQPQDICTCDETGLLGCPVHDLEVLHFPQTIRNQLHNDAVDCCASIAADWFNVPSRDRTKAKLIDMIHKQKRGNR